MSVIDLDQPAATPPPSPPTRRRRQALIAVLMLVSALAGGVVVVERRELTEDKTVKLLIFAATSDDHSGFDPATEAFFTRRISVVNAGPRRVNIRRVIARNTALTAASTTTDRWVEPGTAVPIDLYVSMSCATGKVSSALRAAVTVETESTRTRTVTLDAGAWIQQLQDALVACLSANP